MQLRSIIEISRLRKIRLELGYTKAYPHGISYLKKLDKLATSVTDWKEYNHHEAF